MLMAAPRIAGLELIHREIDPKGFTWDRRIEIVSSLQFDLNVVVFAAVLRGQVTLPFPTKFLNLPIAVKQPHRASSAIRSKTRWSTFGVRGNGGESQRSGRGRRSGAGFENCRRLNCAFALRPEAAP